MLLLGRQVPAGMTACRASCEAAAGAGCWDAPPVLLAGACGRARLGRGCTAVGALLSAARDCMANYITVKGCGSLLVR